MMKRNQGITLIALVITIIVLLLLAGITMLALIGENGILNKSNEAREENQKQIAAEKINLKITNIQIANYIEKQQMPKLQELADGLCEDENDEIQYVTTKSQKEASLDKIKVGEAESIFTKLREYPYEFEIDSKLRLASIDGIKIADDSNNELNERMNQLEIAVKSLQTENATLKSEVETLKNETIINKRIKLMNGNPVSIPLTTTYTEGDFANIQLSDSIREYKYLEIQVDQTANSANEAGGETTVFIATEQLNYNNSNIINWNNQSTFTVEVHLAGDNNCVATLWFKNDKFLHVGGAWAGMDHLTNIRILNIYGIK